MSLSVLFDVVMMVLLVLMLFSTWTLNARLRLFRNSRHEFEQLIRQFDEASKRADVGLKAIQSAANRTGEDVQETIDEARKLRSELSSMMQSAENLAQRLESGAAPKTQPIPPAESKREPARGDVRSKAEQDLLRAMGARRGEGGSV